MVFHRGTEINDGEFRNLDRHRVFSSAAYLGNLETNTSFLLEQREPRTLKSIAPKQSGENV